MLNTGLNTVIRISKICTSKHKISDKSANPFGLTNNFE